MTHPVQLHVQPAIENRDRLTTAFRLILAIPHVILVGGPFAAAYAWSGNSDSHHSHWGADGGLIGIGAGIVSFIAWFAILITGRYPSGMWDFVAWYLRWRVRVVAYCALLRDEYPPFGDDTYLVGLELNQPTEGRNRLSVAFRIILIIPHLIILGLLSIAWFFATVIAWFAILVTGSYPEGLYGFSVGVFRWSTRVEAYMLLLRDEYPPFSME